MKRVVEALLTREDDLLVVDGEALVGLDLLLEVGHLRVDES